MSGTLTHIIAAVVRSEVNGIGRIAVRLERGSDGRTAFTTLPKFLIAVPDRQSARGRFLVSVVKRDGLDIWTA